MAVVLPPTILGKTVILLVKEEPQDLDGHLDEGPFKYRVNVIQCAGSEAVR